MRISVVGRFSDIAATACPGREGQGASATHALWCVCVVLSTFVVVVHHHGCCFSPTLCTFDSARAPSSSTRSFIGMVALVE